MFRLRALGGLALELDDAPYTGPATQRRRLALLAILASTDIGVSRDRLADLLWADADPARGRHSLDTALSALRRELRSEDAFIGVATLRLNRDVVASDVAEYDAFVAAGELPRAAELYRGLFLDVFFVSDAGNFERWLDDERRRRADGQARVLDTLASEARARGDVASAARWWQARVDLDPLDTSVIVNLLRALAAAGRPTEALRVARVHEMLVREELDCAPGAGWADVLEEVRNASIHAAAKTTPIAVVATHPTAVDGVPPSVVTRPRRISRFAPLVVVALLVAFTALAIVRSRTGASKVEAVASTIAADPKSSSASVAVLPFTNTSGDPADEPFTDGLTDELIGALSRVPGIRVTGRTSVFALKGQRLGVRAIADTLGVAAVLEGSVRRVGTRVKVVADLVSASDNGVLWSETYDRELADLFAIQEEIAGAIVAALAPRLSAEVTPVRHRPKDLATYELYLKGRYFWNRRTADDLQRSIAYFEQAISRDSTYADAYAGLADARAVLAISTGVAPREELPRARVAALTAIRLDPRLAEAHAALGNLLEAFDWDWASADRELAQAISLDPSYATAYLYRGIAFLHQRRFDDAITQLVEARLLDPLSAPVHMQLGRAYAYDGRSSEAVASLRAALELNPDFAPAYQQLGDAYLLDGKKEDGVVAFRRSAELRGARDSAQLAYALAATGNRTEAEHVLESILQGPDRYLSPVPMAMAYVALRDDSTAFRWLERGYNERAALMNALRVLPAFDRVRADPRWLQLLGKMEPKR
jgi:TolB-like protein/DNA-binding SARP family transcriptional activator